MTAESEMLSNGEIGKRLLNAKEAAGFLGLKVDTVYKKARLRELPSVKVGRALRFDVKALERFVEQHTIKNHRIKETARCQFTR
jgi:excisionase family DNA binding protein